MSTSESERKTIFFLVTKGRGIDFAVMTIISRWTFIPTVTIPTPKKEPTNANSNNPDNLCKLWSFLITKRTKVYVENFLFKLS
jgi:hypothetical protein